jgi:hypothetical protein
VNFLSWFDLSHDSNAAKEEKMNEGTFATKRSPQRTIGRRPVTTISVSDSANTHGAWFDTGIQTLVVMGSSLGCVGCSFSFSLIFLAGETGVPHSFPRLAHERGKRHKENV